MRKFEASLGGDTLLNLQQEQEDLKILQEQILKTKTTEEEDNKEKDILNNPEYIVINGILTQDQSFYRTYISGIAGVKWGIDEEGLTPRIFLKIKKR